MVPGRPVAVLACRYHGHLQVQPFGSLAAASDLSATIVGEGLNHQPPMASGMCGSEPDQHFLLIFLYNDDSRLFVLVGCDATNGDLTVRMPLPPPTPSWVAELGSLGSDTMPPNSPGLPKGSYEFPPGGTP